MKVLVVGGGGREHAIIRKLKESSRVSKIYCAPGNGGISKDAECFDVKATDIPGQVSLAKKVEADLVVVAPDDPLVLGMTDAMQAEGFKVFGPNKAAAVIEGSKIFSKNLMRDYKIPTARYEVFDDAEKAIDYIKTQNTFPAVIKADGLALGKGVIIAADLDEAVTAVRSMIDDKVFGESGSRIVVEEFLTGPEVSVLCFTDGKTIKPMVSSMDHKRALDGDKGLNTGGMGTVAPNPHYTADVAKQCMDTIFLPTVNAMADMGRSFSGCLYFGLMLTPNGPKVIEYNCRFGDPETQVVLPLLKTDLADIFEAVADRRLDDITIEWENRACACVIMASGGYPKKYDTGFEISGLLDNGQLEEAEVFHAGTRFDGVFRTAGGRVLGIASVGEDLQKAIEKAYKAVETVSFEKAHYRTDIGKRALLKE